MHPARLATIWGKDRFVRAVDNGEKATGKLWPAVNRPHAKRGFPLGKINGQDVDVSPATINLDEQGTIRGETPKCAAHGASPRDIFETVNALRARGR